MSSLRQRRGPCVEANAIPAAVGSRLASAGGMLALLVALAGGCKVDQAAEVGRYREALDGPNAPGVRRLEAAEPLTLGRALALANQDNERLSFRGEEYLQALIDKRRIASAFLPTIALAPNYYTAETSDSPNARAHRLDVPVQAGYAAFNPVRSASDLQRAGQTVEQRRELLLDLQSSILLDAARLFYQILRSERQVEVLTGSLAVQDERVRDVEAQQEAGTVRPLDVAQARAQAAATRVVLQQARGDVSNARSALALVIGAATIDGPLRDGFSPAQVPPDLDASLASAAEHRRDLLAARAATRAARQNIETAFAQYYPSLTLNFQYFLDRQTSPTDSLYDALIQANVPIFTAGRIHQDVRAAWSIYRQAVLAESLTQRQVRSEVQIAWQNLLTSGRRLTELEVQLRAAKDAFEQASDLVRFGRATNLERLVAQDQLLTAQLQMASEQFNRKVFWLELQRVSGGLTLASVPVEPAATQPASELIVPAALEPVLRQSSPTTAPSTQPAASPAPTTRPSR